MAAIDDYKGIWVFAEQRGGRLLDVGLEILGQARRLADERGQEVAAVLLGDGVAHLSADLFQYGADKVYLVDHPELGLYRPDPFASAAVKLVDKFKPAVFILGATAVGRDLAPTIAARLETGLSAHCTGLEMDSEGKIIQIVPVFGGSGMTRMICPRHRPQMATVRPGVFTVPEPSPRQGEIIKLDIEIPAESLVSRVLETRPKAAVEGVPLEKAEVVVAGGAGVDAEGWKMLGELADLLHGQIGGTRPPMDDGYIGEGQMIGQSGKTIRPNLYIGVAISGETQHTVGIYASKVIVAINKDPDAPIMKLADYAIVADYRTVVPALIERLRQRQG
ncbi:MAG: electron transfer flavoprotein subunit alpha/FixB family protein [Chloroflexota bacterium]